MKRTRSDGAPEVPRRDTPVRIGPAVLRLVDALRIDGESVEIRLSPAAAEAIDRIDAQTSKPGGDRDVPARLAVRQAIAVDRATATRWRDQAWRAVGAGRLAPADAQAISDQLEPRGAA